MPSLQANVDVDTEKRSAHPETTVPLAAHQYQVEIDFRGPEEKTSISLPQSIRSAALSMRSFEVVLVNPEICAKLFSLCDRKRFMVRARIHRVRFIVVHRRPEDSFPLLWLKRYRAARKVSESGCPTLRNIILRHTAC